MERLSVSVPKSPRKPRARKLRPIKVVYISNPMRVTASESEFRAVVQELTGRDSDVADNMAKYCPGGQSGSRPPAAAEEPVVLHGQLVGSSNINPFEMLDQALMPPFQYLFDYQHGALRSFES